MPIARAAFLLRAVLILLAASAAEARAAPFRLIVTDTQTPLVPNSVLELAQTLGYYAKAGVDVELVHVQQTPSAVAALHAGGGDMANIGFQTALQLVAQDQMKLRGVISPDRALPFLIAAKAGIPSPKDLAGKIFGIARIGSADDTLSRIVLAKLGVDLGSLQFLVIGQPEIRAQALAAGRLDATTISIGVWSAMPERSSLHVMVDQTEFYRLAPFVSKLNVVTDSVVTTKAMQIAGVVRAIITASRDFAAKPDLWVDAMTAARPDVGRDVLVGLANSYRDSWSVDGGLDPDQIKFTSDTIYRGQDFAGLRRVEPSEWIDRSFIASVVKELRSARGPQKATP